jgi:hypothetical protein
VCVLIGRSINKKLDAVGINNETVDWYHAKWWKCSAVQDKYLDWWLNFMSILCELFFSVVVCPMRVYLFCKIINNSLHSRSCYLWKSLWKKRYDSIVQHAMVILVQSKRVFARASIYVVIIWVAASFVNLLDNWNMHKLMIQCPYFFYQP